MNANSKRTPQQGDHVSASGQEGEYIVCDVDEGLEAAELQQMGSELRLSAIPWASLTLLEQGAD
jgi:hypothetical protein